MYVNITNDILVFGISHEALEGSLTRVLKCHHGFVRHLICGSAFMTKIVLSIIVICLGKPSLNKIKALKNAQQPNDN